MDNQPKTIIEDIPPIDIPKLVSMAKMFHAESPSYRHISFDEDHFILTMSRAMYSEDQYLRGAYHNKIMTGFMVGYLEQFAFNPAVRASEMGLYVLPDSRGSSAVFKLLKDFEQWALIKGAAEIVITTMSGINTKRVNKLYTKLGYKESGTFHRKFMEQNNGS